MRADGLADHAHSYLIASAASGRRMLDRHQSCSTYNNTQTPSKLSR
jgi:hypothetical protein